MFGPWWDHVPCLKHFWTIFGLALLPEQHGLRNLSRDCPLFRTMLEQLFRPCLAYLYFRISYSFLTFKNVSTWFEAHFLVCVHFWTMSEHFWIILDPVWPSLSSRQTTVLNFSRLNHYGGICLWIVYFGDHARALAESYLDPVSHSFASRPARASLFVCPWPLVRCRALHLTLSLTEWVTEWVTQSKLKISTNIDARTLKFGMKHPFTQSLIFRWNQWEGKV